MAESIILSINNCQGYSYNDSWNSNICVNRNIICCIFDHASLMELTGCACTECRFYTKNEKLVWYNLRWLEHDSTKLRPIFRKHTVAKIEVIKKMSII